MTEETITQEAIPEEEMTSNEEVDTSESSEEGSAEANVSLKDVVNEITGRTYKSDEDAIKGVAETYKYVGAKKEEAVKDIDPDSYVSRDEYEQDMFYAKNSDYEPYKDLINGMRKDGQSVSDVVQSDSFKNIFEKAKAYDESQSAKSIIHSPRLGKVTDKLSDAQKLAQEAKQEGDYFESAKKQEAAGKVAVDSVLEAYDL